MIRGHEGVASGAAAHGAAVSMPRAHGGHGRHERRCWTERLAGIMRRTRVELDGRLHTTLSCNVRSGRPVLFLPPDMGSLQPRSLAYLHAFARRHEFGLVEDRRRTNVPPPLEQRDRSPPALALGIALLLRQTGMPGGPPALSSPHRLAADGPHVDLATLVRMAARANRHSKRVVTLPNRRIVEATGQDTHPIVGRACRLSGAHGSTVLSQFESPSLRCIGYSSARQYVVHVFLAGGTATEPELWTRLHMLTHTSFRFRLFPGATPEADFGLFHTTFHFDLGSGADAPWWLAAEHGMSGDAIAVDERHARGDARRDADADADAGVGVGVGATIGGAHDAVPSGLLRREDRSELRFTAP